MNVAEWARMCDPHILSRAPPSRLLAIVVYVKCKYLSQSESSRLSSPAPEQNGGRHWQGSPVMNGHA